MIESRRTAGVLLLRNQAVIIPTNSWSCRGQTAELRGAAAALKDKGLPQAGTEARRWQSRDADSQCGWKAGGGAVPGPRKRHGTAGKALWAAGCGGWAGVSAHGGALGWNYTAPCDGRPRGRHRGQAPRGQEAKGPQSRQTQGGSPMQYISQARTLSPLMGMGRNPSLSAPLWTGSQVGEGPAQFLGENVQS